MTDQRELKYDELQEEGLLRQKWMEDPKLECPIEISQLTLNDLDNSGWDIDTHSSGLPDTHTIVQMQEVNIPDQVYHITTIERFSETSLETSFKGRVGEGVLFIEDVMRSKDADGPWISELSKAVYENHFDILGLRYVFVTNIGNEETKPFMKARLDLGSDMKAWESDTAEFQAMLGTRIGKMFQAMLGTRIGKMLVYLVLGSFQRGTRRISRIAMWRTGNQGEHFQARFDIESS